MKSLINISLTLFLSVVYVKINGYPIEPNGYEMNHLGNEVEGVHFHTVYFQTNPARTLEAESLREKIRYLISNNYLTECVVDPIVRQPATHYPVGNFNTCCNGTSLGRAIPWFMQNHGNLSVLIHGLTTEVLLDHSERAMWLGERMPLDFNKGRETPVRIAAPERCIRPPPVPQSPQYVPQGSLHASQGPLLLPQGHDWAKK